MDVSTVYNGVIVESKFYTMTFFTVKTYNLVIMKTDN